MNTDYWSDKRFRTIYWRRIKRNKRSNYTQDTRIILQQALNEYKQISEQEEQPPQPQITEKEQRIAKGESPLIFGEFNPEHAQHGILTPDFNVIPTQKRKRKKSYYNISIY